MIHHFTWFGRATRLRASAFAALMLVAGGCDSSEPLSPDTTTPTTAAMAESQPVADATPASASFAGGIPIGIFAQPLDQYGSRYNGGHKNIAAGALMSELASIRSRGGKVILTLTGNERYYKTGGHFSLDKWKARVNRYKGVNFTPYINDGTIIGHYLIDEPNDPRNWGGRPISPSVVEELARYSKQLWPGMATIARVEPDYLLKGHRYLDAAWAQYLDRKGNPGEFIRRNVADAQARGLQLVVGLNLIHGGTPQGTKMTASEIASWGSALLESSYPCAFISWTYESGYLANGDVRNAMDGLRRRAESRGGKSCRS